MKNKYQKIGAILIIVTLINALLLNYIWFAWATLAVVGAIDLYIIYVKKEITITGWIRKLWGRAIDNIVMLSLVGIVWYLRGETIALWFLLGLLNNHFFENEE